MTAEVPGDREPARARSLRIAVREAAVFAFFACLSVFATRPLAWHLSDHVLSGPDPAIYVWTVNWLSGHLLSPGQLFEGNVYHPTPHAAVLSDLAFGTALLVAPLRAFLGDPVVLCNVGVLVTLAFGAWAFWVLVRGLTGCASAGLLAGTLAAFGPHQVLHVYQLALVNVGFLALFLLALHRTFDEPRRWASPLFLGTSFALNALSSGYFAVAGAGLALVFAAVRWRRLRSRAVLLACAGGAVAAVLLLAPYVTVFVRLQTEEGIRRLLHMNVDQAFHPFRDLTSDAYLYRGWLGETGERLFPGLGCLALALVACVRRTRAWSFYLAGALVMLVLSLGPEVWIAGRTVRLPYAALFAVRPFNAMMHPYSFAGVARLCVCVLAGLGWASFAGRRRSWPLPAALLLGLAEVVGPGVAVRPVAPGVPEVYRALDGLPPGAVLELPMESPDALIWAARHGKPVVNGAGAMSPRDHGLLQRWILREWFRAERDGRRLDLDSSRAMARLLKMPVQYVVVPVGRDRTLRRVQDGFERSRFFRRVAGERGGDTLYRRVEGLPAAQPRTAVP